MNICRKIETLCAGDKPIVTIGNFDGVHRGHASIFNAMRQIAVREKRPCAVYTFSNHPRTVLYPEKNISVLTSLDERLSIMERAGIDTVVLAEFTPETALMHAGEFVHTVVVTGLHASHMVIGYDHAFGKNREGSIDYLYALGSKYSFGVTQITPCVIDGHPVSSTRIRDALTDGNIAEAELCLGRPYTLYGSVTEGIMRGRTLGFPTANLMLSDSKKLVPANGVYATWAIVNGTRHRAVTSIGTNPTFENICRTIETHIIDFDGNIYGMPFEIEFAYFIRSEERFASAEDLKKQIERDIAWAKESLK